MAKRPAMVKLRVMVAHTAPKRLATAQLDTVRSRLMAALMAPRPLLAMVAMDRSKHLALLTAPRLQVTELLATAPKPLAMALDTELLLPDTALLLAMELKLLDMEPPLLVMEPQQAMEKLQAMGPTLAMEPPGMDHPTDLLPRITALPLQLTALATVPLATVKLAMELLAMELMVTVPRATELLATVPPVTVQLATVLLATEPLAMVNRQPQLLMVPNHQLMAQATETLVMAQHPMAPLLQLTALVTVPQVTDHQLVTAQLLVTDLQLATEQPLATDQLVTDLLAMVPPDTDLATEAAATTAHGEYQVLATVQM